MNKNILLKITLILVVLFSVGLLVRELNFYSTVKIIKQETFKDYTSEIAVLNNATDKLQTMCYNNPKIMNVCLDNLNIAYKKRQNEIYDKYVNILKADYWTIRKFVVANDIKILDK